MKKVSINELMVRYGVVLEEENSNQANEQHYFDVVEKLVERGFTLEDDMLETEFVEILEALFESTGEMLYSPEALPIHTVDVYVRGLVKQLYRFGLNTTHSCDGHDRRHATIGFEKIDFAKKAQNLFEFVGLSSNLNRSNLSIRENRKELPQYASKLAEITLPEAETLWMQANPLMKKTEYNALLEQLLSIYGVSREESTIRNFVMEQLKPYVDYIEVDHYGNVLAQINKGNGPTVLLNAHLDTVDDFVVGRQINKEGNIWSSSEGVLGADDRAGVCILLAVAKTIHNTKFNGKLKLIFTVEEEIGLVGARHIAKSFLWEVDMAFVVDRRGSGDIVTSCGGYIPFCSEQFARQVEGIARQVHPNRWKSVVGGSSDTRIWAEQGINSINLSVGYMNEHTDAETLDIEANYGTYELLVELLENSRTLTKRYFDSIQRNRVLNQRKIR